MTVSPLRLFSEAYADPIDVSTQLTRLPPNDAPCPRDAGPDCRAPFCTCLKPPEKEESNDLA